MMVGDGWIGVDLDGTLAQQSMWRTDMGVGEPVPRMLERVKTWLAESRDVRIFTARVGKLGILTEEQREDQYRIISDWCVKHLGQQLPITCQKDNDMAILFDDRCVRIEANTGRVLSVTYEGEL